MGLPVIVVGVLARKALFGTIARTVIGISGRFLVKTFTSVVAPWILRAFQGFLARPILSLLFAGGVLSFWKNIGTLLRFDWNKADSQIDKEIENQFINLAGAAGGFVGYTVATFTVLGSVVAIPRIGWVVAKAVTVGNGDETGELLEEVLSEGQAFITRTWRVAVNVAGLALFKSIRGSIRWLAQKFPWLPGANKLAQWGVEGSKPFVIYNKLEEAIEKISDENSPTALKMLERFVEEGLEEFVEGATEAAYILDAQLEIMEATRRASENKQFGQKRIIEVDLNKRSTTTEPDPGVGAQKTDRIYLQGQQNLLAPSMLGVLANHQIIHRKDLGLLVGMPAEDYVANRILRRQLQIVWKRGKDSPPWKVGNKACGEVTVTIPNPKVGLTWERIKTASRRWTWGKFEASALLQSGRKVVVRGATRDAAIDKLKELLTLTSDDYYAINVIEEAERNTNINKTAEIAYPAYAILLVRRDSTDLTGRLDISGKRWDETPIRFDLWTESEPPGLPPLN